MKIKKYECLNRGFNPKWVEAISCIMHERDNSRLILSISATMRADGMFEIEMLVTSWINIPHFYTYPDISVELCDELLTLGWEEVSYEC